MNMHLRRITKSIAKFKVIREHLKCNYVNMVEIGADKMAQFNRLYNSHANGLKGALKRFTGGWGLSNGSSQPFLPELMCIKEGIKKHNKIKEPKVITEDKAIIMIGIAIKSAIKLS